MVAVDLASGEVTQDHPYTLVGPDCRTASDGRKLSGSRPACSSGRVT